MAQLKYIVSAAVVLSSLAQAVPDVVDLTYSKYRGLSLSNGVSQWLGIRYAAPPLDQLRFSAPQDPSYVSGVQNAFEHGPICLGVGDTQPDSGSSEDCLFMDVQAPSNATESSKLPVYFFIQGGGFAQDSNPNINASGLIMASDYNIVVVSFNYRVGPYGFLVDGKDVTTNNGLRDQRKAMEWVQQHIEKFGGNPDHVVLGGDSAGAASISYHLTANNGTNLHLFHGAAAESPSFALTLTIDEAYYWYRQFATRLGCVGTESLACLRSKTALDIQAQNFNIPLPGAAGPPNYQWEPVIDHEFVSDYPYRAFSQGKVIKVPSIFGDDMNGGTIFTPQNTSTLAQSNTYLLNQYPTLSLEHLGRINELYPNPNKSCPSDGCYWRQVSNVYQEARYKCPALFITASMVKSGVAGSYAYLWNVQDPTQEAEGLGVPHTVELNALFGPEYSDDPPESYKPGGLNARASPVIQGYWTSFIRTLDPNVHRYQGTAKWAEWTTKADARLEFDTGGKTGMRSLDSGLRERCDFWAQISASMDL